MEYTNNVEQYDIVKNPNEVFYEKITKAVEKNGYYCPCLINKSDDTICSCRDFRESFLTEEDVNNGKFELFCHCKRFKKVLKEEFRPKS
jgi:hypothetical protein